MLCNRASPVVYSNLIMLLRIVLIIIDYNIVWFAQEWDATVSKACSCVLSSYNMSFRDTLEVVTAKLQFMRTTVKQLGGLID